MIPCLEARAAFVRALRRGPVWLRYESPVPGTPTDRVERPSLFTLTRAPRVPAEIPTERLLTLILTPGASRIDLRKRNDPIVMNHQRGNARMSTLILGIRDSRG